MIETETERELAVQFLVDAGVLEDIDDADDLTDEQLDMMVFNECHTPEDYI